MDGRAIRSIGADRWVLGLVLILVLAVNVSNVRVSINADISEQFARLAYNIVTEGVYAITNDDAGNPLPTIVREPVQPAFLAVGMALFMDSETKDIGCLFENPPPCDGLFLSIKVMQSLVIVALALLIYGAAVSLCGRGWWAVIAVALFLLQGNAVNQAATHFGSELTAGTLLICHAFLLALVARDPQRRLAAVLAGVALGLLVLTKAIFIFYIVGGIALLGVLAPFAGTRRHVAFRPALIVALVAFAVMSAWIVRNIVVVDSPLLTQRGNGILVRRAEHGTMDWDEVAASFIFYAPYVGRDLAEAWFEPEHYNMLRRYYPKGYHARVRDGGGLVNARTARNLEHSNGRFASLIRIVTPLQVIIENLPKQLVLSASFMWRGMGMSVLDKWTGIAFIDRVIGVGARIFTIVLVPAVIWATLRAARRRQWPVFFFLLPASYAILIHAGITHGLPRFTSPVIPCAIVALCWLLHRLVAARREAAAAISPG
jgi:4-amino-4-deoxy-L-arabinose transferase-like glycosyltransferase